MFYSTCVHLQFVCVESTSVDIYISERKLMFGRAVTAGCESASPETLYYIYSSCEAVVAQMLISGILTNLLAVTLQMHSASGIATL